MRNHWSAAIVLIWGAVALGQGKPAEVTVTIQQGLGGYAGCASVDSYKTPMKGQPATVDFNKVTLVFDKLKVAGKNPKVAKARLLLNFREEAYTRIKTATLQMFDAAAKEGQSLDSVKFAQPIPDRITKDNRALPWNLPAELVQKWLDDPASNKGVYFLVKPDQEGRFQFIFDWTGSSKPTKRPALEITYSFEGDVPPNLPELKTGIDGKTLGQSFTVEWAKIKFDLRELACTYEVELAAEGSDSWKNIASAPAEQLSMKVDPSSIGEGKKCRLRVSAVNSKGLRSEYAAPAGMFMIAPEGVTACVWPADAVTKVQREQPPVSVPVAKVALAAARNEFQSFQVILSSFVDLADVDVAVDDFTGPGGAKIAASNCRLYRVHYVDCKGKGFLPDSMVPLMDPRTGKRIGGKFGAPFDAPGGFNYPIWCEVYVPADAVPGTYAGVVRVGGLGKKDHTVGVELVVYCVTLPRETTLLTYFELSNDLPSLDYLHELHRHRIDVWEVSGLGIGHTFERVAGKPVMKWNAEYDKLIDSYFDGSLFADKVPGKSWLLRRGAMPLAGVKDPLSTSDEDRAEILKQYEGHYKGKSYASKLAWFFIDEPRPETIKKCIAAGRQIKEYSPSLRFLLTTRYNKELEGLVDIWDSIINNEVIDWNAPGPDAYRQEMAKGRTAINCITVNSNTPTCPNIFIHQAAMNTRIWPWVTFALDQQGIEFWDTKPAPSVLEPRRFGDAWGDGSLFYRGTAAELGVAAELPLPSIRLKLLRDGIQDHELLSMLKKKDPQLARALCRKMVQETREYDKSFESAIQHMSWNWNTDGKGDRQVPGHVVWESNASRLSAVRAEILKALASI